MIIESVFLPGLRGEAPLQCGRQLGSLFDTHSRMMRMMVPGRSGGRRGPVRDGGLKDFERLSDQDRGQGCGVRVGDETRGADGERWFENEGLVLEEVLGGSQFGESGEEHDLILNNRQVESEEGDDVCTQRVLRDLLNLLVKVLNCDGTVLLRPQVE